jgi:hypothetical protein
MSLDINEFLNVLRKTKRKVHYSIKYGVEDFFNTLTQSNEEEIVNEKEMRVVGMRRSGNHAIINWIWKQQGDGVMHLNNLPVRYNPYRFLYEYFPTERYGNESRREFSKKDLLIYSYEDKTLEAIADAKFEKKHDLYFGKSFKRYDIIILRDPFNMYASRLKMKYERQQQSRHNIRETERLTSEESIETWLSYAKEFLGESNYLKNNKVCINYNSWCIDVEYRKKLTEQLDLEFSDAEFNRVKGAGGGSSFDGLNMRYEGSKMKVGERWKVMAEDPLFINMIKNPTLLEYSYKIFGDSLFDDIQPLLSKVSS